MSRTIREYLWHRMRQNAWVTLVLIFLAGACAVLAVQNLHGTGVLIGHAVAGLVLVGGFSLLMRRLKCPKCSKLLGNTAMLAFVDRKHGRADFCPHCGVSFDEPMPQNPISPAS